MNGVEQSRIEAKGSVSFKGIKSNISKKHLLDLKKTKVFVAAIVKKLNKIISRIRAYLGM